LVKYDKVNPVWRNYYFKVKEELLDHIPLDIVHLVFKEHIFTGYKYNM
jgi:hypothetical protein